MTRFFLNRHVALSLKPSSEADNALGELRERLGVASGMDQDLGALSPILYMVMMRRLRVAQLEAPWPLLVASASTTQ